MLAYAQEAGLLGVKHFAPLERTREDIQSGTEFYVGALRDDELVGALALGPDDEPGQINIASLVVHPARQRQGIARMLVHEALRRVDGLALSAATGARNAPALALYREFGFVAYRRGTMGPEELEVVKLRRAGTAPSTA